MRERETRNKEFWKNVSKEFVAAVLGAKWQGDPEVSRNVPIFRDVQSVPVVN